MADTDRQSDGELLSEFLADGTQACFDELVQRHGNMVLNVGLRMLGDRHAAEDAAQATFLALIRKARSLCRRRSLAGWLYHAARNVSLHARRAAARRAAREKEAAEMLKEGSAAETDWTALRTVLDDELASLPRRWRQAIVLFHLEERSLAATAEALDAPAGTVSSWITRGRQRLKKRLARRGIAMSLGALATFLSQGTSEAALSMAVAEGIGTAAGAAWAAGGVVGAGAVTSQIAGMMEGGLKMMLMAKVKTAALALLTVGVVGTTAVTAVQTHKGASADQAKHVILRDAEVPISMKDARGETYVAVPVDRLKERSRRMWSPGAGMTYFYSRLLRLTREEQSKLQKLLEEAWLASDGIEDAFDVTTDGDSVVATLRVPGGLETLQDVRERVCAKFMTQAADTLGPERAEIVGWFEGRTDRILQLPSWGPEQGITEYRMKLTRPEKSGTHLRIEVDSRSGTAGPAGERGSANISSGRVSESVTFRDRRIALDNMRLNLRSSTTAGSGGSVGSRASAGSNAGGADAMPARLRTRTGGSGATRRLVQTVNMAPWPRLGERLGIPRSTVLEGLRNGRKRYWESRERLNRPGDKYREAGQALTPPPIGAFEKATGKHYVYVSLEQASKTSPLTSIANPSWRVAGTRRMDRAAMRDRLSALPGKPATEATGPLCIPAWADILRLDKKQADFLAGRLEATAIAMYAACAEHLTVTQKTDDEAHCRIDGAAFKKFTPILASQKEALRKRLGNEVAGIVHAFYSYRDPVASGGTELVWNMSGLKQGQPAAHGRVDVQRKAQSSGRVHYTVTHREPDSGKTISSSTFAAWDLPPFLAALWDAPATTQRPGPARKDDSALRAMMLEGLELMKARKYDPAIQQLRRARAAAAKADLAALQAECLYWEADCHGRAGHADSSRELFKGLTIAYPESKWAKYARGRLSGSD